jgi:hypothetical protein
MIEKHTAEELVERATQIFNQDHDPVGPTEKKIAIEHLKKVQSVIGGNFDVMIGDEGLYYSVVISIPLGDTTTNPESMTPEQERPTSSDASVEHSKK